MSRNNSPESLKVARQKLMNDFIFNMHQSSSFEIHKGLKNWWCTSIL